MGTEPALAGIRAHQCRAIDASLGFEQVQELIWCADIGVPRLLAAIEAVLKRHQPSVRRQGWPPTCKYDNRRWPCPEVQDITAALSGTGKEGSEDE